MNLICGYAYGILHALSPGPLQLGELCIRTGYEPNVVSVTLRELAAAREVFSAVVRPPKAKPDDPPSERARIFYGIKGQAVPSFDSIQEKPPQFMRKRPHRDPRMEKTPYTDTRALPMEILARMAGRTTFRNPKDVTGIPVTAQDVAHALAAAVDSHGDPTDPLGKAMAMAIACQRESEWPNVEDLGRERLLDWLRSQRHYPRICAGAYTYRARIALHDAFTDLIYPARRRKIREAAKDARMSKEKYRFLLKSTMALLEAAANTAAADAVRYLFALAVVEYPVTSRIRAVSYARGGIQVWTKAAQEVLEDPSEECALDIESLMIDVLLRPRRVGLLTTNRETA